MMVSSTNIHQIVHYFEMCFLGFLLIGCHFYCVGGRGSEGTLRIFVCRLSVSQLDDTSNCVGVFPE